MYKQTFLFLKLKINFDKKKNPSIENQSFISSARAKCLKHKIFWHKIHMLYLAKPQRVKLSGNGRI